MTGCMIAKTRSSGCVGSVRGCAWRAPNRRREPSRACCACAAANRFCLSPRSCDLLLLDALLGFGLGRVARKSQEHVIEGRTVQAQLLDLYPCGVEFPDHGREKAGTASHRRPHVSSLRVHPYPAVAVRVTLEHTGSLAQSVSTRHGDLEALATDPRLELGR